MITFDNKGVATRESQAHFDTLKMQITLDPSLDSYQKSSRIQDLYNQYGMQYGTYNRIKGAGSDLDYDFDFKPSQSGSDSPGGFNTLLLVGLLIMALWGMNELDQVFASNGIEFRFSKMIEGFFQWVF